MKMVAEKDSKVSYATSDRTKLKIHVPKSVAEALQLKSGDRVEWYVLENDKGERYALIKKAILVTE